MGIQGYILRFFNKFLNHRSFRIQVGNHISNEYVQENGVPQGSVVSPDNFSTCLEGVLEEVEAPVHAMLLADDMVLFCAAKCLDEVATHLQTALDRTSQWLVEHGFTISTQKTVAIAFARRRILNPPPLYINEREISYKDSTNFLGLTFDSRLNWCAHIKKLKANCLKAGNILKMISNTSWGADRTSMLMLYRSLIRSKLDYGSVAYGSASLRTLLMLDTVHHGGLRQALGAFRSSPALSLLAEAGEPPLNLRRELLLLRYYYSILASPSHPLHATITHARLPQLRIRASSFLRRARDLIAKYSIDVPQLLHRAVSAKPPWTLQPVHANLTLTKFIKKNTSPLIYQNEFKRLCSNEPQSIQIFTDGSKATQGVGAAFIIDGSSHTFSLPKISSVYTAELLAINKALNTVMPTSNTICVFTDSLSTLLTLHSPFSNNQLIIDTFTAIDTLNRNGSKVVFVWIPSHCGINNNEKVDELAKKAIQDGEIYSKVLLNDVKALIRSLVWDCWERQWRAVTDNKLREIKSTPRPWTSSVSTNRKREVVIARLRIGHSRLTHGHLMAKHPPPICEVCVYTVLSHSKTI